MLSSTCRGFFTPDQIAGCVAELPQGKFLPDYLREQIGLKAFTYARSKVIIPWEPRYIACHPQDELLLLLDELSTTKFVWSTVKYEPPQQVP